MEDTSERDSRDKICRRISGPCSLTHSRIGRVGTFQLDVRPARMPCQLRILTANPFEKLLCARHGETCKSMPSAEV